MGNMMNKERSTGRAQNLGNIVPAPKAQARHAAVGSVAGETIQVPYLGNMNDIRTMPVPASGMDRAEWFASSVQQPGPMFASASGANRIGMNQRGVGGPIRGSEWTDGYYTGYITTTLPSAESRETDSLDTFWKVQMESSKGLNTPSNDQVYVNKDTSSVWT
jgi:hypothetical protein